MNIRKSLATAAIAAGLVALPVAAQRGHGGMHGFGGPGGPGGPGGGPGFMLGRAAIALDLTEAQKQTAQKLAADARTQSEPIVAQLKTVHEELAAAVKSNNVGAIGNITTRQGNLHAQLAAIHAKSMAAFYAQLTPEQKAKADKFHETMKDRRAEMGERFKARRDGQRPQQR